MLLRPATRNCGRNIGPLFKIAAVKFQDAKFRTLPHSGSGNRPLPLLQVQLRLPPPLFITAWHYIDEELMADTYGIVNLLISQTLIIIINNYSCSTI
jgi:hypothetical protein